MRPLALALALAGTAGPLAAQANTERIVNERDTRPHDYDLVHQRIELGDFDWEGLAFDGRVATTVVALRPGFDSIVLDAGSLLRIDSVAATGRPRPLRWSRLRDSLIVHLDRAVGYGDTVRFVVAYRGRVENGRGLTFVEADSLPPRRPRQIWSQGQAMDNHRWFPTWDFPSDKATWEIVVTVPRGYTAVSNGRLAGHRTRRDGSRVLHWRQERPASTYLASIVVAPLVQLADRWRGLPVEYSVYREDSANARALFGLTPDLMEFFSRYTGVDYPWPRYAQTTVADFFGGMENVGASTMVDWVPTPAAYRDRPWYHHVLIAHELAHQWFGNYVTTANWANMWLNEGFAEFLPGQYWGARLGPESMEEYYLEEYRQFMEIDSRRRMPLASLGSNNIYPKGALVLRMLQQHLGDERFRAGVRRYLTRHALDVATSDDLRQAFRAATGESLDWFWEQWVYRAGIPELRVSAAWDSSRAALRLVVEQTQRDTLPIDPGGVRFTVPEVFRLPLVVRVGMAEGEAMVRVWLDQRKQEFEVPGVASSPVMVIVDDGNAVLKRLTFDQPTAWLATQLVRDRNLWNRAWVIDQLARRPADPGALAALVRAATGAEYFDTRLRAAGALGRFPGPAAGGALVAALADTSAPVRAVAVQVLGERGDTGALVQVRRLWTHDPSEAVRAQALLALTRLAPEAAAPLIRAGLRTASYLDAIAEAAVQGAIERGDQSLLPALDSAAAQVRLAMLGLGVFGAGGRLEALEMLDRHLQSSRATVRQRALEVYHRAVPDSLARARLRAVRPMIRDARFGALVDAWLEGSGQ